MGDPAALGRGERTIIYNLCRPNKSTVYPEFMPSWIRIVGERADRYLKAMVSDELSEDVLLQEKETAPYHLYHREDTHWNLRLYVAIVKSCRLFL